MKLKQFIFALVAMLSSFAFTANAQVAKVGTTEYSTIDEALNNWKAGTTLTLLDDVQLSGVVKINSNESRTLDLGTFTMKAAKNQDAFQYVVKGCTSDVGLSITADATNPGGIEAPGKAIITHTKPLLSAPEKDRPYTQIFGGVFTAANIIKQGGTFGAGYTGSKAPRFVFHGGVFNGDISTNRSLVQIKGGTFNGKFYTSFDSSSWGNIQGGKFMYLSNLMGSDLDEKIAQGVDHYKFTIGSAKATYDRGIYVDKDGYYVITSDPITEVSAKYPAVYKKTYGGDDYFYYSAAQEYGLFYEDVDMAIAKHGAANVTVWVKPAVTIPETLTGAVVEEIKNNTALKDYTPENLPAGAELEIVLESVGETFVYDVTPMVNGAEVEPTEAITFRLPVPASVTEAYAKVYHDGTLMGIYAIKGEGNAKYVEISSADFSEYKVVPIIPAAKIGEIAYATLTEAFAAVTDDNQTVVICKDVTENLTSALRGNITTENGAEVTVNLTNSDWVYCQYTFVLGENITLNVPALFYYAGGSQINGTVVAGAYYQRYAGTKLTINEPGSMTVTSETCIIRYMDGDANAGIYINGDNNPSTVGLKLAVAYFYQGMINAKDANIVAGTYWQTNETDDQGSANLVLDNSTLTVTVYDHPAKATGNSTVTLTNGSVLDAKNGGFTYGEAAALSVDATSKIIGKDGALVELPVAKIGTTKYTTLQAAINAVKNGETITLIADVEENVTLTEKAGLYYTIDGNGKKMNGTITVSSLSDTNDNRRITIKNINFVTTEGRDFITSTATNHYPRITVEGCSFTGTSKEAADCVAIRLKSSHSVVIKDCTGTGLHSFLQNTAGWNLTIENVTVTDSKSAFALGTVQGVTVKGCTADVDGYGIRLDAQYNNNAVIESNTIEAFIPVVVRKATDDSNITVKGENTMTATNEDGLWMAIGTSEYEANGTMPTAAEGKVKVAFNETNLTAAGVYGNYVPVAKIGDVEYTSLEDAFKAATEGCEIVILENVTVDYAWDARYTGGKFTVPVTINGNGKTIKFTASVNDNNYQAPFRFEADATVKNLTVDMSETTDSRFRAISSKGNLTVDGCTFIGKDETLNCRAIIFGEGAGANVGNLAISVTNSKFINWKRGITDNENGQDVKTATITGNTLENAAVYVSAYENVTFTGNTVEGAYVDIRSYTANSSLNVTATGNTLEENTDTAYNYIKATGNIDQEGFKVYAVAKIGDVEYTTIEKAYAALQEGDEIVILKKGSYALKVKNNITITGAVDGVEFANIGAFGCNGANVTFNNVTFTYAENSTYKGLQHSGNLVYNNCTFNGQVFLYGASETFNKCTFNTTDSNNYNVWTYGAKEVAFNECTFNSAGKSVLIYSESASVTNNVTVVKSQFNASQAVEGKAAIEMDSSLSGAISLTIDGETTATGFGTGNISGNSLWNNKKGNETEANNDITVTVNNEVVLKPIVLSLSGTGTEANPYLINNVEELLWLQAKVDEQAADGSTQFAGKYFKMTADIDLAGINWNPIGSMSGDHASFKGVFDGDGHTISNLYVEQAGNGLGLFAYTSGNAVIKNLNLVNVTVKSTNNSNYVGGVVGNAYASTKIENVHVSGNVLISGRGYIGGIAGHGYVVMDNVSVVANEGGLITSTFWCAGGVLGYAGEGTTNITNAHVEGLTITSAAGGLGAIVGMAEDNNGTQPISGSDLSAKNVEIKTYVGDFGTSYQDYAIGYLYGGNETSKLTGTLSVENVTLTNASGNVPATIVDAVATVDGAVYFDFAAAVAAADGKTIKLFKDVVVAKAFAINGKEFTLDGNGKTISQAADCTNTYALFDINGGKVTIKNVTFDGVKGGAVVRTVGTEFAMDNVTAQNCEHTQQQGLFRLVGKNTITNSTFKNNKCSMVLTLNFDAESNTPQVVDNCLFEGNTVNGTAALYYVKGAGFTLTNSEFVNNAVNCNSNGATIYLGFTENNVVTGNLFQNNTVTDASTSTRVAGAIFFGYAANVSGNAFINNTASNANGDVLGQVCTSTYYNCTIDLSRNYWGDEAPVYGKDYTIQHQTGEGTFAFNSYYTSYDINEQGNVVVADIVNVSYAAKVGKLGYATIKDAVAAVKEGETITILAGTHTEGSIKLPATLKNVTIKGETSVARSTEGAILKDMTITAADGNTVNYEGLTFDGIIFDNSIIVFTGMRNGLVSYKNIAITNCKFLNIERTGNYAAFHFNSNTTEAINGFTFTNNVIDGVSGSSNSGINVKYCTGEIKVEKNIINNVAFRPYLVQVVTNDGVADNFVSTGNTFSGSAAGRLQVLGNNAEGTDAVNLVVSNNIFKDITESQQFCYYNFNPETTNADFSKNYYDIDILANPSKIYYNSAAASMSDLVAMGVFPVYTALNEDGTIDINSAFGVTKVATKSELATAIAQAVDGSYIIMTADIDYGTDQLAIAKAITLDLGGYTLTTANAYGGMSIKNNPTVKNGTIVHASNTAAIKVWNATAFEDLVIDVQGKGDANKTIGGIVLQSGNTTNVGSIKNVTIKGAALTNGIETYNCGDAQANVIGSMENVTIEAQGTGMLISAPCGTATNCSIKGGTNGIEIWIKGNYSASLNLVDSDVEGGVYAHDEFNSNPNTVNNGTLNFTADANTTGASAADVTLEIARAENVEGVLEEIMENAKAKVNNVYHATVADAFKAAKAGDVVTVFAGTYAMPSMKAGITIVGEGNVLFEGTLSGTLEDLTMKNIHIKGGNAQRWAYAKGNLVFENVTFEATSVYALHFDGITEGTNLTYKNCTIIGWAAMGGSPESCEFDGCTFKGNGTYGLIRTFFDAAINNCTFDVANVNTTDVYQDGIHATSGATITVTECTNVNGDMKAIVNVSGESVVVLDGVNIQNVAKIGDNYYLTLADAVAAATAEATTITMVVDAELAETVTIPADKVVTLDLNGKTITATDNATGSFALININPEAELTINGEGAIKLTATNNRGWNAYSSVISNQRGKLTVNGGTIEHLGGTDMAYAIDNLTNTGAQNAETVINGGTVKSTYRAIRQFLNSTSAQNVLTVNGGTIEGANKSIWMQGANANANPGALTVAAAAAIKGDVYLTTAAGTAEYPVVVAVAADALKDGAQVLTSNVPADFAVANVNGTWSNVAAAASLNGKGYATLRAAVEAAQNGETVELLANVTLAGGYEDATEGLRIEREITLNGNGHTIDCGTFQKGIRIYNLGTDGDFQVKFNNVEVVNNVANGRCIDTRSHDINLTITDSKLIAQNGNSQPLTIGGSEAIQRVKLDDAIIDAGNSGYGVIAFVPVKQNIYAYDNTKVTGYAAFYLKDHGNANIKLSLGMGTYIGKNIHSGASNAFGTVVLEGDNNVLQILGTNPILKAITEGNASQAVVLVIGANNKVSLESESATIDIEGENAYYGMISAENAGTTTIINKGNTMFPVAEVGGFQFMTIKEAIRYAGNEGTIKAINDCVLKESWTVAAGQNITFDLNGKTVSYTSAVAGEDMITNRGNLTITDSSDAKTGKLAYVNTDNTASNVTVSTISTEAGSTLVVDGGTIENKTVKADGSSIYSFAIDILTNGNLGDVNVTINGGTVYSDYMAIRQFNNGTACMNSLTINGGYIYGAKRAVQVHMDNNAAVTAIIGGKVEAGEGGYAICNFAATSNLAVTGGEFIGAVYSARENFISGGIYDAEVYAGYCAEGYMPNKNVDGTYGVVRADAVYASINGHCYESLTAAVAAVKDGETITLLQDVAENVTIQQVKTVSFTIDGAGKTYTGTVTVKGDGQKNGNNTETLTFQNINFAPAYNTYAITSTKGSYARNITVDGCTFKGNNDVYGIRVRNGYNYTVKNTTAEGVYTFFNASESLNGLTVENVTVKCANVAFSGAYGFGNASFKGVTVESDNNGVKVNNPNSSALAFENCSITAKTPVTFIENAGVVAALTAEFNGNNTMVVNNGGTYWFNIVEADATNATFKAIVNDANLDMSNTAFAASVGNVYYSNLTTAINEADNNATVVVARDIELDAANCVTNSGGYSAFVNVAGKATTIDLNGKEITANLSADKFASAKSKLLLAVFAVDTNGNLTLNDSEGTGKVAVTANDASVYSLISCYDSSAKLTINGGSYELDVVRAQCSLIHSDPSEAVVVNGGNFYLGNVNTGVNNSPWIFNVNGNNTGHVIVNGGTFNYDVNHQYWAFEVHVDKEKALQNNGNGTWTVVDAVAYVTEKYNNYTREAGYATIEEAINSQYGNVVTILAGEYTQNLNVNKAITVKGEVDENGNNLVTFNGKLNITADGATVENLNFNNSGTAAYVGAKNVTIDGCSLVGSNGLYQSYTSGTVTFKNSYIKGGTYGIHFDGNAGGNIVIENCTVIGWTSFAGTINSVAISGTTFAEGNYNQLRLYQNATISDCTFNEKMNIDWGSSNKTAEFDNCSVEGDKELTEIISLANIATKGLEVTIDGERVCVAAKVDSKYYLSLQAAIDAATEGQTVTIVSDIALTEGVTVAADKNIFIDLNGKTVSMETAEAAVAALIKNNGTLTIESSVDGGKLSFLATAPSAANAYASNTISNYGTLTINAGTVENLSTGGACYALDNYAGSTATINGGKLTAEKTAVRVFNWTNGEANAAKLNVVGGEIISNDGYGININAGNAPYVALNISGGTITTNDTDYNLAVYVVNKNSAENFTANISGGTFNGNLALNGVTSTTMAKGKVSVSGGTFDGVICYDEPACQFITGGSYMTEFTEDYLVYGYQLTGDAAPYTAVWTGRREVVTIVDGAYDEYSNENDIEVGTLTYKRNVGTTWTPLYVPFEVPVEILLNSGFEVGYITGVREADKNNDGEIDNIAMEIIQIKNSGAVLHANHPYFVRSNDQRKLLQVVLEDATLYSSDENTYDCRTMFTEYSITGNLSLRAGFTANDRGISAGNWEPFVDEYETLNPFRFYLTIKPRGNSPFDVLAVKSMSVVVRGEENEDGTTTIYDVEAEAIEDMIFDLQGRRVLETEKGGIYIKGGKKFIAQ